MSDAKTPEFGSVVVTGGCGFIGFHIVNGLLKAEPGCDVHVADVNVSRNTLPGVTYHKVDISSAADVERVFLAAKPRTVFHLACPDSMVVDPPLFRRVNVVGTRNVLDSSRKVGVRAFIHTSTSSVVHDNVSDLIDADEDMPILQPPVQKRVYTLTKAQAEMDIAAANRQGGDSSMLTVNLRPATVFGERDTILMANLVRNIRAGRAKTQIGPGGNKYDVVYVGNLVDCELLAARALLRAYGKPPPADKTMRVDGEAFNVTNRPEEPMEFWDFQRAVAASIGMPVKKEEIKIIPVWVVMTLAFFVEWYTFLRYGGKVKPLTTREGIHLTQITRTLKGDKAMRVLGYKPNVSLQEGLEIAGKWFVDEAQKEGAKKTI